LCTETHELGEEITASYLQQVHLYQWLKTNGYGSFHRQRPLMEGNFGKLQDDAQRSEFLRSIGRFFGLQ
jgi:hypothetical protein